ncbi:MAG: hypothetical protein RBS87_05200 [Acholeplasma sp.]|jgi:hypothetical protein|nr:hypothetical protein [Acholeplasma sp.]
MTDAIKFLSFLQDRLNIQADELADFLFIDIRTLYNYKNFTMEQLPSKIKEKLIIFFQGYQAFYVDNMTVNDIYERINSADPITIDYIRQKFLDVAQIRKKNFVVTHTEALLKKNPIKRDVKSLDDFLNDFRILVEYSNLSKGYLYTLFEIIIGKVNDENDYQFLDYINRYKKGDSND